MLRRALACLIAACLAVLALGLQTPAQAAVTSAPGAPTLTATSASDGVRLVWQGTGEPATSYAIYRGASSTSMTQIATTQGLSYADKLSGTTAAGTTYGYKVQGLNALGGGPSSNMAYATTPTDIRVPTATKVIVVDEGTVTRRLTDADWPVASGTSSSATFWVNAKDGWATQLQVHAPNGKGLVGSYPVQASYDDTHASVNLDGCQQPTGTLTVQDLAVNAEGKAVVAALDADLLCSTGRMSAVVRLGTDSTYPYVNVPAVDAGGVAPSTPHDVPATYANEGNAPVQITDVAVTGDAWAIGSGSTCKNATVAPGQSCQVGLVVTPALGNNPGTITFTDSTAVGKHTRALVAAGVTAPVKPVISGFSREAGEVTVTWSYSGTPEQRATSFRVLRGPDAANLTEIATRTGTTSSFTDPSTNDGTRTYVIEAVNGVGTAQSEPREADLASRPVTGLAGAASATETELSWVAPTGLSPYPVTGYAIFRGATVASAVQVATTPYLTWEGPAVAPGTHAFFDVAPVLRNGSFGPRSAAVELVGTTSQLVLGERPAGHGIAMMPLAGGAATAFTQDDFLHPDLSVHPNGTWLSFSTTDGDAPRQLWMVKTGSSSTMVPVATGPQDEYSPTWSPDGRQIAYAREDADGVTICRTAVTVAGGGACTPVTTRDTFDEPSWLDAGSLVASDWDTEALVKLSLSGVATPIKGTAGGYTPVVSPDGSQVAFLAPGPTDFAEVIKVVTLATGAVRTLPAPGGMLFSAPSWTRDMSALFVAGLTESGSHVYRIGLAAGGTATTVPGTDGQYAVAVDTPDTVAPVNVKLAGVPAVTLGTSVTPTFSASDALNKVASYSLSYRRAGYNGGYSAATVKALTKPTPIAVARGYSYCFSVRATDRAGNTSAATPEQCVMVPLDDRSLARSSGFTPLANAAYYAGTAMKATGRGQTLTRTGMTSMRQLTVIGSTCPTCGSVDVLVGGRKVGAVSFASRTSANRKVFTLPAFSVRSGTVVLKVTSTGKPVTVDGLGFRK